MAHPEQQNFIQKVFCMFPDYFTGTSVFEAGSLNINGSFRFFFKKSKRYIGVDLSPGKGVDVVCEAQNYNDPDNSFDVCVSGECFEHNPFWQETFTNMHRLCKPNGLIIMTCATEGRPEHGTSKTDVGSSPFTVEKGWEYYKNLTEEDFKSNFSLDKMFNSYNFEVNNSSHDLYFWGLKQNEA